MSLITELNQRDWFDYLIDILSALGSLGTAGAFIYVFWQARLARVQQFENNFFQLLNLHNQITSEIKADNTLIQAVAGIKGIFLDAEDDGYGGTTPRMVTLNTLDDIKTVFNERYYEQYYNNYEHLFNHYFRNLYHIFKFIYQSKAIKHKQKKSYAAIARAQLSQKELFIIMCNAMYEGYGYPNFLFLIKKFKLLDNFRDKEVDPHILFDYFLHLKKEVLKPKIFK